VVWNDRRVRRTVLIVDDHADFRAVARALLERAGLAVVGEAATGSEAIAAAGRLEPEIVLLDIQLPDQDGFAVAERLAAQSASCAVVLISGREASAFGPRLARAPARGFIPKRALSGEAVVSLVG
jgi:DNA-binding NarL/FixJ family response regulator